MYAVKSFGAIEEYICIDTDFTALDEACRKSECQFLTKDRMIVGTLDSGGTEFPDLIVRGDVFLLSDMIIAQIREFIEDYVFLKPVEVCCDIIGKKELYWITVPPRIDCLNLDESEIDYDWDFELGIMPILHAKRTVIDESLTGRYGMFKISGVDDNNIYIKQELMKKIISLNPEGIKFVK